MSLEVRPASGLVDLEQIVAVRAAIDPILEPTVEELRFWRERLHGRSIS